MLVLQHNTLTCLHCGSFLVHALHKPGSADIQVKHPATGCKDDNTMATVSLPVLSLRNLPVPTLNFDDHT